MQDKHSSQSSHSRGVIHMAAFMPGVRQPPRKLLHALLHSLLRMQMSVLNNIFGYHSRWQPY
jgi:hypothetical protein